MCWGDLCFRWSVCRFWKVGFGVGELGVRRVLIAVHRVFLEEIR